MASYTQSKLCDFILYNTDELETILQEVKAGIQNDDFDVARITDITNLKTYILSADLPDLLDITNFNAGWISNYEFASILQKIDERNSNTFKISFIKTTSKDTLIQNLSKN